MILLIREEIGTALQGDENDFTCHDEARKFMAEFEYDPFILAPRAQSRLRSIYGTLLTMQDSDNDDPAVDEEENQALGADGLITEVRGLIEGVCTYLDPDTEHSDPPECRPLRLDSRVEVVWNQFQDLLVDSFNAASEDATRVENITRIVLTLIWTALTIFLPWAKAAQAGLKVTRAAIAAADKELAEKIGVGVLGLAGEQAFDLVTKPPVNWLINHFLDIHATVQEITNRIEGDPEIQAKINEKICEINDDISDSVLLRGNGQRVECGFPTPQIIVSLIRNAEVRGCSDSGPEHLKNLYIASCGSSELFGVGGGEEVEFTPGSDIHGNTPTR